MNADPDWVTRCADRLRQQWPHALVDELHEAAQDLHNDPQWSVMPPEVAAVQWLRLGVLAE